MGSSPPHEPGAASNVSQPDARPADDSTDDRRVQRHRQILETAKAVFAERGYHNASINEIITRANIARGTFYLYFSNKHKVFDSILDEALSALRARISRIEVDDPTAQPPHIQLRDNLVRVLEYVLSDQPLTRLLLNLDQHPQSEVAERVEGFFLDVINLIRSSLERGIEMKLVRQCDTALVASALLGTVRGMVSHCLKAETALDIEAIVDELLALVGRGVLMG